MYRLTVFLAGLLLAAPASAATYSARPVAPAGEARLVARDIVWTLSGQSYRGQTEAGRPLVLCQALAKRAGRLESFTVDGRPFSPAELARCNAAAPGAPQPALADAN